MQHLHHSQKRFHSNIHIEKDPPGLKESFFQWKIDFQIDSSIISVGIKLIYLTGDIKVHKFISLYYRTDHRKWDLIFYIFEITDA